MTDFVSILYDKPAFRSYPDAAFVIFADGIYNIIWEGDVQLRKFFTQFIKHA
jgi:hypothetical protein